MFRIVRSLILGAGLLASSAAGTHAQEVATVPPVFTVDDVRSAFSNAGYRVDQAHTWDWTTPPVTSFTVDDASNGRVLLVLVYPDSAAADQVRARAAALEQRDPSLTGGPHLVPGYGRSTWDGNVAMVQSTEAQLQELFQAQEDRDNGVYVTGARLADSSLPNFAVDLDFLQALQGTSVNL